MASLYSCMVGNAATLSRPTPDCAAQFSVVGGAAASDRAATSAAIVNVIAYSPAVVEFQLSLGPTAIYIDHSPNRYLADMASATPFDDLVMVLVGEDLEEASPVVLEADSFDLANTHGFYNKTHIKGANGYDRAADAEVQFDRQAQGAGAADTA